MELREEPYTKTKWIEMKSRTDNLTFDLVLAMLITNGFINLGTSEEAHRAVLTRALLEGTIDEIELLIIEQGT